MSLMIGGSAASDFVPVRNSATFVLQSQTVDGWVTIATYEEGDMQSACEDCEVHATYEGYAARVLERFHDPDEGTVEHVLLESFPDSWEEHKEITFSWLTEGF